MYRGDSRRAQVKGESDSEGGDFGRKGAGVDRLEVQRTWYLLRSNTNK